MNRSRVLSCIQPSGEMHIGNYFGAIANWVTLQAEHSCVFGVVDLHAMTMPYKSGELRSNSTRMVLDLLACGIDLRKSIVFLQSLVPEHTELSWILSCVCSYGDLSRQTQFKDKSRQLEAGSSDTFISAGLFGYPVLQAADILVYRADWVPVGKDQEQHLELTRTIANRFNLEFGEYFVLPKLKLTEVPKIKSLADPDKKMSKSLGGKHYVGLFEDEDSIRSKVRSAVTDSGEASNDRLSPGVMSLLEILYACGKQDEARQFRDDYRAVEKRRYAPLKDAVASALVELTQPFKERRRELIAREAQVIEEVYDSSAAARKIAVQTLRDVRERVGLPAVRP